MGDNNFVIRPNGNIGMGINIPIEKLEVNGKIKADDIIFNTDAFENNLAKNSTFANILYDTIHNEQINIYDAFKSKIHGGSISIFSTKNKNQKRSSVFNKICSGMNSFAGISSSNS